jgi:hypothetical protein
MIPLRSYVSVCPAATNLWLGGTDLDALRTFSFSNASLIGRFDRVGGVAGLLGGVESAIAT